MILSVFRRRLNEGASFADFQEAWEAEKGFGVPTRVFNAVSLTDPREILSIGFVSIEPEALLAAGEQVAAQEDERHRRIDDVIESTELRAMYVLETEHDLTDVPRQIDPDSVESLLSALMGGG